MIPVYICEDDEQQLKLLKSLVVEIINDEKLDGTKLVYATKYPVEIIEKMDTDKVSLYLLDIDFGEYEMSGLDLASKIRSRNINAWIVMITAYDFALDTYKLQIGVKDYIMKGDSGAMAARIKECLKDMYYAAQAPEARYSYLEIRGTYKLNIKEIYYISAKPSEKRRVDIYTKTGTSVASISLKEIILQKNTDLFQCHRSYVVNINYVKEIDYDNYEIIMSNGAAVPVGIRRIGILKHKLSLLPPLWTNKH